MKKFLLVFLVSVTAEMMMFPINAYSAPDKPIVWSFALTTAGKPVPNLVQEMSKVLLERTKGRFTYRINKWPELGYQGPEMITVFQSDQQKIGQIAGPYVFNEEPVLALPGLPFTSRIDNIAAKLNALRPFVEEALARHNIKLLSMIDNPHALWSKIEVNTIEDVKKLKIRAHPELLETIVNLGGTGVTLPLAEIYQGLATGIINSAAFSAVGGSGSGYAEVTKFIYLSPVISSAAHFMVVSKTSFDSLPKDVQQVLVDTAREFEPKMIDAARLLEPAVKTALGKKIKIIENMNPPLIEQIIEKGARPVWKKWVGQYPKAEPAARAMLNTMGIKW